MVPGTLKLRHCLRQLRRGCRSAATARVLETRAVPLRPVDAIQRVALGRENRLLRFTRRPGDDFVVLGPSFVDQAVALLLRLVDLVPGRLHRIRRVNVLQNDRRYGDTGLILITQFMKLCQDSGFNLLPRWITCTLAALAGASSKI